MKKIICVDCGDEFEVKGNSNKRIRCNECQKKHLRKIKTEKQRKYRVLVNVE